jgi:sugar phosphate isomerase/epimerase
MVTLKKISILISFIGMVVGALPLKGKAQHVLNNRFFAMNNCLRGGPYYTPKKAATLLKSLGYDGIEGYDVFKKGGIARLKRMLNALDKRGLKLYTVYMHINLDNSRHPYDPRLKKVFRILKARDTMPWFNIQSHKYKLGSAKGDSVAIPILRHIADMAHKYGLKVMLYPHAGTWMGSVQDAIRVAKGVNRRNLGFTFNLVHYLAVEGINAQKQLQPLVDKAMPYLFAISLNGADKPTKKIMEESYGEMFINHFIKPLGEGNYNVFGYLLTFIDRGFQGPVGLQCYGIDGNDKVKLKKSMQTWKYFKKEFKAIHKNR